MDYFETYAPVVKIETIRLIFALIAAFNMMLKQYDIKTAFLYGDLAETIYMEQPEGFHVGDESSVCLLKKSLYGLKQAPKQWNKRFTTFLLSNKLTQMKNDPCVFYDRTSSQFTIVAVYVDDLLLASTSASNIEKIQLQLENEFDVRVLSATYFLGLTIKLDDHNLTISQENFINKIVERFGMVDCNTVARPINEYVVQNNEIVTNVPYREAVGAVMYSMTMTRPDIAFTVGYLSRYSHNPTNAHWLAVKRLLRYLKEHPT